MHNVSFQEVAFKRVYTRDCGMEDVNFNGAFLDGCAFGRIKARNIKNLDRATITQGGATGEEVEKLRRSIKKALGVSSSTPKKRKRPVTPER